MKIDPLKRWCICGYYKYFSKWDYVKMILFDSITFYCPVCHRKHKYKLIYYAIEKHDKDISVENKRIIEGKSDVWKKG